MIELKPGDTLFVKSSYSNLQKIKVSRLTNTQIILEEYRSKLKKPFTNGCSAIGSSGWGCLHYFLPTEELEEDYKRQQLLLKISKINFTKISTSDLQQIVCISDLKNS